MLDSAGGEFGSGSGHVLRISGEGSVHIAIRHQNIQTLTGFSAPSFQDCGIAFYAAGNLYFAVWNDNRTDRGARS